MIDEVVQQLFSMRADCVHSGSMPAEGWLFIYTCGYIEIGLSFSKGAYEREKFLTTCERCDGSCKRLDARIPDSMPVFEGLIECVRIMKEREARWESLGGVLLAITIANEPDASS